MEIMDYNLYNICGNDPVTDKNSPEGIRLQTDSLGRSLPSGALSISEIEVLDLISEGQTEGLVSGRYYYSGNIGDIGWRQVTFSAYPDAPGLPGVNYLRSIYWNSVPVVNEANQFNFQRIDTSYTVGFPNGSIINPKDSDLTISQLIGERLYGTTLNSSGEVSSESTDFTKVYRVLNPDCKGIFLNVKIGSLSSINQISDSHNTAGRVDDSSVQYKIFYKPIYRTNNPYTSNFILGKTETIIGNINYGYIKSTRVDFFIPDISNGQQLIGWEIKIIRTTPDSLSAYLRNQTYIDSITEIYSDKFCYPNSAIVRSRFDAQFFQSIPDRAFDAKLLKVQIPNNYEPISKTYIEGPNGWDGTFSDNKQWTDNPAWCYYDLCNNPRYGLARFLPNINIDKWTLYEISKTCDTIVSDGQGGLEPRFSCNALINTRDDAYKVLNNMASIFFGMTYYAQGTIFSANDSLKIPRTTFTNSSIEDGNFQYSSSSQRSRHTVAIVRYNDKTNFYKPAIEYVEDFDGIRRYGIKELDLTCFGCTSRGQAVRMGRWALLSEIRRTETIRFTAGVEAAYLKPSDVFEVFDSNRKLSRYAGRLNSFNIITGNGLATGNFVLDDKIYLSSSNNYQLSLLTPTFNYDLINTNGLTSANTSDSFRSYIQSVYFQGSDGTGLFNNLTNINIHNSGFDTSNYSITNNCVWVISPSGTNLSESDISTYLNPQTDSYSVLNIKDNGSNKYDIVGLQYDPTIYSQIESGISFARPISQYSITPQSPSDFSVYVDSTSTSNKPILRYSFVVNNYSGISSYRIYSQIGQFNNSFIPSDIGLINTLPYNVTTDTFIPSQTGIYYFRSYSVNDSVGIISTGFATGAYTVKTALPVKDIIISSLRVAGDTNPNSQGTALTGTLFTDSPTFIWQAGTISDSSISSNFNYRLSIRQQSNNINTNLPSSNIYFDTTGIIAHSEPIQYKFNFSDNISSPGGPYRNYDVVVEAIDSNGNTSAGNTWNNAGKTEIWTTNQLNSNGYDILRINNNRPSGFYLSPSGGHNYNGYNTYQWMDTHSTIYGVILSGNIPSDVVGGFLYSSTGSNLSGIDWVTGKNNVTIKTGEFTFDQKSSSFNTSSNWAGLASGSMSISLYDSFDSDIKDNYLSTPTGSKYFLTGLYISNAVPFIPSGSLRNLDIQEKLTIFNINQNSNNAALSLTSIPGSNWILQTTDEAGNTVIIATKN